MAHSEAPRSAWAAPQKRSHHYRWPLSSALVIRSSIWYFYIGHAYTHLGQFDPAIEWCRQSISVKPFWIAYADLAASYAWTGRQSEAQAAVAELRRMRPDYTVARWLEDGNGWSDNTVFLTEFQRIGEGLRKAGLPE